MANNCPTSEQFVKIKDNPLIYFVIVQKNSFLLLSTLLWINSIQFLKLQLGINKKFLPGLML